jgi:hypothetical protein
MNTDIETIRKDCRTERTGRKCTHIGFLRMEERTGTVSTLVMPFSGEHASSNEEFNRWAELVAISMCTRVVEPITLIRLLSVVVLIAKKSEKVIIFDRRGKVGSGGNPTLGVGKEWGRFISSRIDDGRTMPGPAPPWGTEIKRSRGTLAEIPHSICGPGAWPSLL